MTKQERKLWYGYLCTYPCRFRRQFIIGNYIADFYCHEAKLVIEVDGSQHYEPEGLQNDALRTAYMEEQGLMVIRFANNEVMKNFSGVCKLIDLTVKENLKKSDPACAPPL